MKPLGKVKLTWSPEFSYAIGLLVTDGSLSKDGRHIELTSKDKEQLETFLRCLDISVSITSKYSGSGKECSRIQFGDVNFYRFLLSIGLMPNKTKIIAAINIPDEYFFDFLRGHFDGDGTFYSYWDSRWKSSFMFYISFVSASKEHIVWIQNTLERLLSVKGHITHNKEGSTLQLKYAKRESVLIIQAMYHVSRVPCLLRKRLKIEKALSIMEKHNSKTARVAKLVTALP